MIKCNSVPIWIIVMLLSAQTIMQAYNFIKADNNRAPLITETDNETASPKIKPMPDLPKTKIVFDKTSHDFGIINDSQKQYVKFEFHNSGTEPLMILSAEGSCGCTVPTWPKEPIQPGNKGFIEISFDPNGKSGEHAKIVTITANTQPTTTLLTIKANIVKSN